MIGVTGLWHLGCVLCACWAAQGYQVVGHDPDVELIENLRKNQPPIYEPGLPEALAHPNLTFTSRAEDLKDCSYVFVARDTPVDEEDNSLLGPIEDIIKDIADHLKDGTVVIISAQSPVGFCARLRGILKSKNSTLELAYSPENLRLGQAIDCYLHPGHIVLGTATPECEARCKELLGGLDGELMCMNLASAEAVKHGINSFLATSIVFTNQLANVCEQTGASMEHVIRAMKADPRIGKRAYLEPGVGFSGGTLGRDLKVLQGHDDFFGTLWERNHGRKNHIVKRVGQIFGPLQGLKLGVLGLTYKPGTSTLRRSVPVAIVEELQKAGVEVRAYDPRADYSELPSAPTFQVVSSEAEAARGADALLLLTAWPDFGEADWAAIRDTMARPRIFDTKNVLRKLKGLGFEYHAIGGADDAAE